MISFRQFVYILLAGSLALAACKPAPPAPTSTPVLPTETPTPEPTTTATPVPWRVAFVALPGSNSYLVQEAHATLSALTDVSGAVLDVRSEIQPVDISEDWRVIIYLGRPANFDELVASAPQVQFVLIDSIEIQPTANVSLILLKPERQAFLAGYISTMIAPDYRTAALLPSDEPRGPLLFEGFYNGGGFYCGRCPGVYMPVLLFPIIYSLPAASDFTAWQAGIAELQQSYIYVMYVDPEIASPELINYLAQLGLTLVGGAPPPDEVRGNWAATIKQSPFDNLTRHWDDLLGGQGGFSEAADISVTDINETYLTPGKQRLVDEVIQKLAEDLVSPISPPYP
jgi:hypothetical protein